MDSFYLTLPCRVNNDTIPVDKQENFITNLPRSFDLVDNWEVGLTEITFPKNWRNIPYAQKIQLAFFDKSKDVFYDVVGSAEDVIKPHQYTIDELIDKCNEAINKMIDTDEAGLKYLRGFQNKKITQIPRIELNESKTHVRILKGIINTNEGLYVRFDRILGNILGFHYGAINFQLIKQFTKYMQHIIDKPLVPLPIIKTGIWMTGIKPFDMNDGIRLLYIMSDVCDHSIFGEVTRQLLKIVQVPKDTTFGDQITKIYDNPQYIPLFSHKFSSVNIKVLENINYTAENSFIEEFVPFGFGIIMVTLHFRKIKSDTKIDLEPIETETEDNVERGQPEPHPLSEVI
jgi:hypothetical protein